MQLASINQWRQELLSSNSQMNIHEVLDRLDSIENELDETCMKFPLDADGIPVKPRDRMVLANNETATVIAIGGYYYETNPQFLIHGGTLYAAAEYHHEKKRTIDDAIDDFIAGKHTRQSCINELYAIIQDER